jgi:uncharacterized protein (TIGR02145 family)
MKKLYLLFSLGLLLATNHFYAQNDTLYVWKAGIVINKQSVKTVDVDSIIFYKPTPIVPITATVTIGTQVWTTKNLDVATYRDGTVIPQVTDPTQWKTLKTGAWCYNANNVANGTIYGKLYNWYAVAGIHDTDPSTPNKTLAPVGYHIPTDVEWFTLTNFLGGDIVAGRKMKATGTTLWQSPNADATNSSGFTGLPGGDRYLDGTWSLRGYYGFWWSASEYDTPSPYAWTRDLYYEHGVANRNYYHKMHGFSVRCLAGEVVVAVAPTVTTTTVTAIVTTTATSGGNVTNDGGAAVTARGVVYSTTTNPTIALTTKTVDGTGIGTFASSIEGLTANTTYYVRAYATNGAGTSYGNEISFKTLPNVAPAGTVTIGTQTWTTKNLDVTTYRDGTVIPQVTDPAAWAALTTGAWCYYNNSTAQGTTYGKLYNWYAVVGIHDTDPSTPNKTLAPAGYHIPTDAEWTTLITFLGGADVAGGKMKSIGTSLWQSPNMTATNISGFTGLPGGERFSIGTFIRIGYDANWWSSTVWSSTDAEYFNVNYNNNDANNFNDSKKGGFSVRCLMD